MNKSRVLELINKYEQYTINLGNSINQVENKNDIGILYWKEQRSVYYQVIRDLRDLLN